MNQVVRNIYYDNAEMQAIAYTSELIKEIDPNQKNIIPKLARIPLSNLWKK